METSNKKQNWTARLKNAAETGIGITDNKIRINVEKLRERYESPHVVISN